MALDNLRYAVVDLPADLPVLLVDGSLDSGDAVYLPRRSAGRTGGDGDHGADRKAAYLSQNPLGEFRAIYLLNVERLDDSAIEALEEYASEGGGVAVFLGPACTPAFYNERLYRGGHGLFPCRWRARRRCRSTAWRRRRHRGDGPPDLPCFFRRSEQLSRW